MSVIPPQPPLKGELHKCEFCDKRGLPLLLVRDAIAPAGGGAPLSPQLPIELSPGAAHYTKRVLRSGYVNVYDEARRRWDAYFVTKDGYLLKLSLQPGSVAVAPPEQFKCSAPIERQAGHRAMASCITVSDPKNATKIWVGFSDVSWTAAVRSVNEQIAYRKRHMVEVDVKALLSGNMTDGIRPIAQLTATVADYAMAVTKGKAAFRWTPFPFIGRDGEAEFLLNEFNALRPGKGAIITVPDPAGIVQELAYLMKHNTELFVSQPAFKRNLAAHAAIGQIEAGIRNQAETGVIIGMEDLVNKQIQANPLAYSLSSSTRERVIKMGLLKESDLDRAADDAWKKYSEKFNNAERQAWIEGFKAKLKPYDDKHIAPLAVAHASWMQSPAIANYFECNYDGKNVESGKVYTTVVNHCIASTQDKKACSVLYEKWLSSNYIGINNVILRGLFLNQEILIKEVEKASDVSFSGRQIPWDNIFGIYTKSVMVSESNAPTVAAKLVADLCAPLTRVISKFMDGSKKFRAAVIGLGLVAGHPIVEIEVTGKKKDFRKQVLKELLNASGKKVSQHQLKKAISAELKRLAIRGVPLDGTTNKKWVLVANREIIRNMPDGLSHKERAEWLVRSITTMEHIDNLNLHRWRTIINVDMGFGLVSGIIQAVCLSKVIEDQEKALANESLDATARMCTSIGAIAAAASEVIGNALSGRATQGLRFGQGLALKAGDILSTWGRRAGIVAGLVVAFLDFRKAYIEYKEGSGGWIISSYIGSGLLGMGAGILLAWPALLGAATIPLIGVLLLFLIVVGIVIEYIKDNPMHDWLERCPWGKLVEERYGDMETEQAELKKIFK